MSATILKFTGKFRAPPELAPIHPEGRRWLHGEAVGDGTRYCRAADLFCRCDDGRKTLCDADLHLRPDGEPLQHGDVVPDGRRYCGRNRSRCECGDVGVDMCARVMPKQCKAKKGKK